MTNWSVAFLIAVNFLDAGKYTIVEVIKDNGVVVRKVIANNELESREFLDEMERLTYGSDGTQKTK